MQIVYIFVVYINIDIHVRLLRSHAEHGKQLGLNVWFYLLPVVLTSKKKLTLS